MGKLIVIEGLDGSGKATQTKLLYDALWMAKKQVAKVSFPAYGSDSSALVKMYLAGEFGREPGDVNAYAASSFYAVDRYASYKKDWGRAYEDGTIILADRYTTSNAIHQCAKLPREEWDGFLEWLFTYEYSYLGIPQPNRVLYLQVDPLVSQRLLSGRYEGDEGKKDIHEKNLAYLQASREAAEYCAEKLGWITISCTRDGEMRSVKEIHQEILTAIKD